jgi:hypothetical protein
MIGALSCWRWSISFFMAKSFCAWGRQEHSTALRRLGAIRRQSEIFRQLASYGWRTGG